MQRLLILLALAALGLTATWAAAQPPAGTPAPASPVRLSAEWRDRLVAALAFHRSGDAKAAARELAAIAAAPTPITEYVLLLQAESLSRLGDAAGARQAAEKAAE
ncbi:MAG TPA: hypothetical protein DCQ64_13890, partial [Candidatus Rokubacteria bacterium]|nr:hypothetical protein [Candidatus Rokubacteria bacterium]